MMIYLFIFFIFFFFKSDRLTGTRCLQDDDPCHDACILENDSQPPALLTFAIGFSVMASQLPPIVRARAAKRLGGMADILASASSMGYEPQVSGSDLNQKLALRSIWTLKCKRHFFWLIVQPMLAQRLCSSMC
jgi:hypothetical protein